MENRQIRSIFSRLGIGFTVFVALHLVLTTVLQVLFASTAPQLFETGWFIWALSYIPLYFVCFPVMLLILKKIPDSPESSYSMVPQQTLSVGQILATVAACWAITYLLNLLSTGIAALIERLSGGTVVNTLQAATDASSPILNVLMLVIVAPVMEELIFRHLTFKKLIRFGGRAYVVVSALIFSLFHMNLYQLFYAFVLGLILGYVYYITRSLKTTIILHALINLIGGAITVLIAAYAPLKMLVGWSIILITLAIAGAVILVRWLRRNAKSIAFWQPEVPLPSKGIAIKNPGMIAFLILTLALTALNIILPNLV